MVAILDSVRDTTTVKGGVLVIYGQNLASTGVIDITVGTSVFHVTGNAVEDILEVQIPELGTYGLLDIHIHIEGASSNTIQAMVIEKLTDVTFPCPVNFDTTDYQGLFSKLLPKGQLFLYEFGSNLYNLFHGHSDEQARFNSDVCETFKELSVLTADESLPQWEEEYSMDQECIVIPSASPARYAIDLSTDTRIKAYTNPAVDNALDFGVYFECYNKDGQDADQHYFVHNAYRGSGDATTGLSIRDELGKFLIRMIYDTIAYGFTVYVTEGEDYSIFARFISEELEGDLRPRLEVYINGSLVDAQTSGSGDFANPTPLPEFFTMHEDTHIGGRVATDQFTKSTYANFAIYNSAKDQAFAENITNYNFDEDDADIVFVETFDGFVKGPIIGPEQYTLIQDAVPVGPTELANARRDAVITKLNAQGGQSRAYYIYLASLLGYSVTIQEYIPDVNITPSTACGPVCGSSVVSPQSFLYWSMTVDGPIGDDLVCLIEKYKPAQTIVVFKTTDDLGTQYVVDENGDNIIDEDSNQIILGD